MGPDVLLVIFGVSPPKFFGKGASSPSVASFGSRTRWRHNKSPSTAPCGVRGAFGSPQFVYGDDVVKVSDEKLFGQLGIDIPKPLELRIS